MAIGLTHSSKSISPEPSGSASFISAASSPPDLGMPIRLSTLASSLAEIAPDPSVSNALNAARTLARTSASLPMDEARVDEVSDDAPPGVDGNAAWAAPADGLDALTGLDLTGVDGARLLDLTGLDGT